MVLAAVLLLLATLAGYAWRVLFDADQFAGRAAATLQDERVRTVLADRVTDELVLANEPDLIAARPLIASAVSGMVGSDAFASLFRRGVRDVHRAVFARDRDTVALTLVDVGTVVAEALERARPRIAAELERRARITVLERDVGAVTGDLARLAERLRVAAIVFGALTLAAAVAAVAVAPDRRRAAASLGLGAVAVGVLIVVATALARGIVLAQVGDADAQSAAAAVWDAFLGDLREVAWALAGAGAVVAAAAASLLRPGAAWLRTAARRVAHEPRNGWLRGLRGAALIVAGVLVIAEPTAALQIAATLAGLALVFAGVQAILRLTYRPREAAATAAEPWRGRRLVAATAAALLAVAAVAAFAAGGGVAAPEARIGGCNGHRELCDRPLDEVVLPATHNSMSVPEPGWFAALQERPMRGQLDDGIRGLLLDTHYADKLPNGRVRTFFGEDGVGTAIADDPVSPSSIEAAERLRERLGFRGEGERGIYLCHTFCELGATPLADALDELHDFLVTHPGEVVVVVNQDQVTPADFVAAIADAGLDRYAFRPPAGRSWPTLGEMVEADRRLVVLAENRAGAAPWYQLAYDRLLQETPFSFATPADLTRPATLAATCRANRGPSGAPLFLINHWINTDPAPRPSNAASVNAAGPLLRRARACERLRGRIPTLLAVDFYTRGDVFEVVDTLNGV